MRGKFFILIIFLLAFLLAAFGLVYRYTQTHEVMAFWGPEGSQSISSPDQVELCKLTLQDDHLIDNRGDTKKISIEDRQYVIMTRKDVTKAPGFINASGALILNRNYDWHPRAEDPDCRPNWQYALIYRRGKNTTIVAISIPCGWVYSQATDRLAGLNKSVTEGLARLFQEQLGS